MILTILASQVNLKVGGNYAQLLATIAQAHDTRWNNSRQSRIVAEQISPRETSPANTNVPAQNVGRPWFHRPFRAISIHAIGAATASRRSSVYPTSHYACETS
jgi:hypothetical protein